MIAIVGATDEGKSSLINALLDHRSVLPTSGHRACTAVVVEVVGNAESDEFEADIDSLKTGTINILKFQTLCSKALTNSADPDQTASEEAV